MLVSPVLVPLPSAPAERHGVSTFNRSPTAAKGIPLADFVQQYIPSHLGLGRRGRLPSQVPQRQRKGIIAPVRLQYSSSEFYTANNRAPVKAGASRKILEQGEAHHCLKCES